MNYLKTHPIRRLFGHPFSFPFIWAPLPFLIILDIMIEIYHHICFPIYGLELVDRSQYIQIIDRAKLKYLRPHEKLGCMYCGYANGLFVYLKEIAGRTEKYWCGIMHETKPGLKIDPHHIEHKFINFNDEEAFKNTYSK